MARPERLDPDALAALDVRLPGWSRQDDSLARTFRFDGYADAVGAVVAAAMVAERRDHHPDIHLGWGRATFTWSTHDVGGISTLDVELALETDAIVARHGGRPA